jgi:hypothetical protein
MLAYVFWHTRSVNTEAQAYGEQLLRFHELLSAAHVEWQRQMVLGPAPEYCLMPAGASDLASLSGDVSGICRSDAAARLTSAEYIC